MAADWPQWRGLQRDNISPETGLLRAWPEGGPVLAWSASGLGAGFSSPAVVDYVTYITGMREADSIGVLYAFDAEGAVLWQSPYGPEWTGMRPGTRSCPVVAGDSVFLLTGPGRVVCFARADGAMRWTVDIAERFGGTAPVAGFAESLLVVNDTVVCTPGGKDATVVALDVAAGETVWATKGFSEQSAYCSPILVDWGGTQQVITITAYSVVGVDAKSGEVLWKVPQDVGAKDPNHSISPVFENGLVYATSGHGDGGQLIVLSNDGRNATVRWKDSILNCLHGGVTMHGGHIYGTDSKGKWVCLDAATGAVRYEEKGVGRGSLVMTDGLLICYGEKGTVGLAPATPEAYALTSAFKVEVGEGPHWAHPVLSNGRLYLRHGDVLLAYAVGKP